MTIISKTCAWVAAVALCSVLSSCFGDDDSSTTVVDGNCAITSVTLGTLTRTIHTKTSEGRDSSYAVALAGSSFPMYIDQIKREIYNPDSLPINTNVKRVILSSLVCDGAVRYNTVYGNDTLFSVKDSIDFSSPRMFTCYSADGKQSVTYKVSVNVHNSASESFAWKTVAENANIFNGITAQKAFVIGDKISVLAIKQGQPVLLSDLKASPTEWLETSVAGLGTLDPQGVWQLGGVLYAVDNGILKMSSDGISWSEVAEAPSLDKLVGAGKNELYAIKDDKILSSKDAVTWLQDASDAEMEAFPTENLASVYTQMSFNNNFSYVIIGGSSSGTPIIWKKTVDASGVNTDPWTIYSQSDNKRNSYPALRHSVLFNYDSRLYCLGIEGDTLSNFYISSDAGRNWIAQRDNYVHPNAIEAESYSAVVDEDNYIWLFLSPSGQVIKGRLNRLSYSKNQTVFVKNALNR